MVKFSKHRIIALTLAAVFALFNIGLPIVLYSCPMMQQSLYSSACCADQSARQGVRLQIATDRSCCKTVYAADRNTHEFLQIKDHAPVLIYSTTQLLCNAVVLHQTIFTSRKFYSTSPPLLADDIPVVTSSLLI